MQPIHKIEQKLLEKELKGISEKLAKVGGELISIFDKYTTIKGQHKAELKEFLIAHIIAPYEAYYGGYTTKAAIGQSTGKLPDALKEVILEWVINDFMAKIDDIQKLTLWEREGD